jgi:hypothetical protein
MTPRSKKQHVCWRKEARNARCAQKLRGKSDWRISRKRGPVVFGIEAKFPAAWNFSHVTITGAPIGTRG